MADNRPAREVADKATRDRLQAARKSARQAGDAELVKAIDHQIDGITAERIRRDDLETR